MDEGAFDGTRSERTTLLVSQLVRRGHQRAVDLYVQATGGRGLTHQQFTLLQAVAAEQGLSQTVLVHRTGIDRSTLTDMIGRLVERGLLKRNRAEDDRRANLIVLTAKGRRLLEATTPAAIEADRAFLGPIPPERREELIQLLQRLADITLADEGPLPIPPG